MLKIPFYKQEEDYTCGPVTIKMVLDFFGAKESVNNLKIKCCVSREKGTTRSKMVKTLASYDLHLHAHAGSSIREIRELLDKEKAIIVNFREPSSGEGHYAVVNGLKDDVIVLQDPYNGPNFPLSTREFVRQWYGYHKTVNKNWILAVSRNNFEKIKSCTIKVQKLYLKLFV